MRTFAQKQKPTHKTTSANPVRLGQVFSEQRRQVRSILHSQRTIGSQAVQRLLQSQTEDLEYEQKADRVAEQVMRVPEPQEQRKGCSSPDCKEKDEEEKRLIQSKPAAGEETGAHVDHQVIPSVLASPGQPLGAAMRHFMEPRFGQDFSGVRVHTDGQATESARAVNARAYTVGRDIVFGPGQFSADTLDGKRLLAHELTHTIQQKGLQQKRIQKADFDVDGLPPNAASSPRRIFFTRGGTTIPASEKGKLAAFSGSAAALTLKGTSSEEGSDAANTSIINARLTAVENELNNVGYTGTATRVVDVAAGTGNIEYQRMRSVEIIPPGGSSTTPPSVAVVACTDPLAGGTNYPSKWTDAETEAQRLITDGKAKLDAAVRTASTNAALNRFFGSSTDAKATQVSGKLTDISAQITKYLDPANHQCVNQCSNMIASNVGTGSSAMLTLCPTFFTDTLNERATTTAHEAVHGTSSIHGSDTAYAHHRLIAFLSPTDAIQNPDSYKLLLMTLDGQSPTVGPTSPDVATGMTAAEQHTAKKALAWLEMYLTSTYLQLDTLYERLNGHRAAGTATWPAGFYRNMMTKAAPHFGLTAPPAISASENDQVRLAAVFHRYRIMRNVFWSPVTITKAALNSWTSGPGHSVEVDPAFFGLSSMGQVKKLMELLVHATPDISGALEPHYPTFMEEVRVMLGKPAPPP